MAAWTPDPGYWSADKKMIRPEGRDRPSPGVPVPFARLQPRPCRGQGDHKGRQGGGDKFVATSHPVVARLVGAIQGNKEDVSRATRSRGWIARINRAMTDMDECAWPYGSSEQVRG